MARASLLLDAGQEYQQAVGVVEFFLRTGPLDLDAEETWVTRPAWDDYFLTIARTVATRATCPRASVGAVLTREHRILTTGYNGAPRGVSHCLEAGCLLVHDHCQRAVHAEANAIVQGALHGVGLAGATAYCTHEPCVNCSKLLISAGVERIVYETAYPDPIASELLAEAGVIVEHVPLTVPA